MGHSPKLVPKDGTPNYIHPNQQYNETANPQSTIKNQKAPQLSKKHIILPGRSKA